MSILLEALKKSERQRQLGQTPTLQTPSDTTQSGQPTLNHWLPISLVAISVFAMLWIGWQQFREPESGIVPDTDTDLVNTLGQAEPRTPTENFQAKEATPDGKIRPGLVAVRGGDKDKDKDRLKQSFNEFKADPQEPDLVVQDSGLTDAEQPVSPAPGPSAQPPDRTDTENIGPAQREVAKQEAKPAQSRMEPHVSEPISYWELPQGVRDTLPDIKITVLVYAEQAGDRFLLTNGQRLAEKDELQSGLVLDEIRRDGAVFLYRKYRFLVKG